MKRVIFNRRPRWSLKILFGVVAFLIVVCALIACVVSTKSLLLRLEVLTLVLSAGLFGFLWTALYRGVRVDARERLQIDWAPRRLTDCDPGIDIGLGADAIELCTTAGAEHGPVGLVVGFLAGLLLTVGLSVVVAVVVWIGLHAAVATALILIVPAFVLFRRTIRGVLVRGRTCRGRWLKSFAYALGMTALYTSWLQAILFGAKLIRDSLGQ